MIMVGIVFATEIGSVAIALPLKYVWLLSDSYAFGSSTKANPFGLDATLSYQHDLRASCPMTNCGPLNAFVLSYSAEKLIQLVSYNICGGLYCVLQECLASYGQGGTVGHPVWGGNITVSDAPWKVGDTVDIRLRVQPVGITNKGIIPESENMLFIDLGESKITESG